MLKNTLLFIPAFLICVSVVGQGTKAYTTAQAHSHNDYEQKIPFYSAYYQQFGSMEADLFLRNDTLFVAHEMSDMRPERTLKSLYLDPLAAVVKKNKGHVFSDGDQQVQLLIDLKTSAASITSGYVDGHFSTNDHTGIMVPVFAYGPHSLDFRGVYENTEIYNKILAIFRKYRKQ